MCKHIANGQFAFQAPCCHRWFDCSECHFELSPDHRLGLATELALLCRACNKPFRKDLTAFGLDDETCPHCENLLVRPITASAAERSRPESTLPPPLTPNVHRQPRAPE
uniref:CHY-type domain-containing protein n=1 Tax=Globisporangium ultimum (strain ATCC 200006 / CBS 805.95 / DAOM BR144) TaxID=431595 RepID=K3X695_GLOUD